MTKTVAVMTGGGDCPGLNAAIRTVTRIATHHYGFEVIGIEDGFEGLILGHYRPLDDAVVRGIVRIGGTILGSSNRTNPFAYVETPASAPVDASERAYQTLEDIGADGLIVIGGDGTLYLASRFADHGIPVVGIPKTIDNDIHGTDTAIGFDSCIETVTDAIDKLHTTAESHHRVLLVEVMGRNAGWIALHSAIAGGADILLIPERPYELEGVVGAIDRRQRSGRQFTIAVVAEGVSAPGGGKVYRSRVGETHRWKFGGVCNQLAEALSVETDQEVRAIVLGHLQRGGTPTAYDRTLATLLAQRAIQAIAEGQTGVMVGLHGTVGELVPFSEVTGGPRLIPTGHPLLVAAEQMGIYVG